MFWNSRVEVGGLVAAKMLCLSSFLLRTVRRILANVSCWDAVRSDKKGQFQMKLHRNIECIGHKMMLAFSFAFLFHFVKWWAFGSNWESIEIGLEVCVHVLSSCDWVIFWFMTVHGSLRCGTWWDFLIFHPISMWWFGAMSSSMKFSVDSGHSPIHAHTHTQQTTLKLIVVLAVWVDTAHLEKKVPICALECKTRARFDMMCKWSFWSTVIQFWHPVMPVRSMLLECFCSFLCPNLSNWKIVTSVMISHEENSRLEMGMQWLFHSHFPKKTNFKLKCDPKIEEINRFLIFEYEMVFDLKFNNETVQIDDN